MEWKGEKTGEHVGREQIKGTEAIEVVWKKNLVGVEERIDR